MKLGLTFTVSSFHKPCVSPFLNIFSLLKCLQGMPTVLRKQSPFLHQWRFRRDYQQLDHSQDIFAVFHEHLSLSRKLPCLAAHSVVAVRIRWDPPLSALLYDSCVHSERRKECYRAWHTWRVCVCVGKVMIESMTVISKIATAMIKWVRECLFPTTKVLIEGAKNIRMIVDNENIRKLIGK